MTNDNLPPNKTNFIRNSGSLVEESSGTETPHIPIANDWFDNLSS